MEKIDTSGKKGKTATRKKRKKRRKTIPKSGVVSTTIHCSRKELELIKLSARKRGLTVINFVNIAIKNHVPVKKIRLLDPDINRTETKIGAQIPEDLHELVTTNKELLNSPFQKVAMYHVVLTAVLMECER